MSPRHAWPPLALLAVTTLAGPGCNGLTVDREAAVFSFPHGRQEMRVLLVYDGLRVRGNKPEDLDQARKQLTGLFVDRQEFWLGGPEIPFIFSLRPPAPGGDDNEFLALLRKHVDIGRTELFTAPDGRPCAYQTLTVSDPGKLTAGLNAVITAEMARTAKRELAKPATEPEGDTDRATWGLTERACRGKFDWIRTEPGRFSLTVPASPEFSRKAKAWILGLEPLAEAETALRAGRAKAGEPAEAFRTLLHIRTRLGDLADTPWSFDQRKERFTVSLGYGGGEPIRVVPRPLPVPPPTALDKDLLAFARRLEIPFRPKTEIAALVEEFLKAPRDGPEK